MPEHVNCNVRLFADACLRYRNVKNQSDSELLQKKKLTDLENWEKTRQMKFNPEKYYVICYQEENYKLHSHILQPVDNSKYLGVTISNDLDWGPHINNITTKTNTTLGFLRRNMQNCIRKVKNLTYTSLVCPVVDYSSPVWNPSKKNPANISG